MVMEYLEGHDLGRFVERGRLPIEQAVDYVIQACDALAEAHALDIVHRDLKPENLFLADRAPRAPIVKIIDFGISKVAPRRGEGGAWTQAEDDLGTPFYMSPEQLGGGGPVDSRSDIWALGIVLHELLTGAPPFEGSTIEELCTNILTTPPRRLDEVLPDAPAQLTSIVLTCLEKSPAQRFDSVASLARALAPFGLADVAESAVRIATVVRDAEAAERTRGPDPRRAAPTVVVGSTRRAIALPLAAIALGIAGLALVVYFGVIRARAPAAIDIATGAPTGETSPQEDPSALPSASAAGDPSGAGELASASAAPVSPVTPDSRARARARGRLSTPPPAAASKDPRAAFGERK
jgi:serine/threonine-protein kinase